VQAASGDRPTRRHRVQFYDNEPFLVDTLVRFVGGGLGAGEAAILLATESHVKQLEARLDQLGFDVARARASGRYVVMDAAATLADLLVDGWPDAGRFFERMGAAIERAARRGSDVRVFGEMASLLCADGRNEAALQLERLWAELGRERPFSLLCTYPLAAFASGEQGRHFLAVCDAHADVAAAESYPPFGGADERDRAIAHLQQKASSLEGRAEETASRLAALVESSDDAIIGKALDGIITSWNRGAERLFGFAAEEMVGRSITEIIPEDRRGEFATIIGTIRAGKRVDHFETERLRKDGRRIFVSLTVSPIRDAAGRVIGASKIARDVTERRRLDIEREELIAIAQRARAEAEATSRSKDDFLATLAHELRSPLAAVRNAVVSARLDPNLRERAVEIAFRQTEQLTRLVDDLLDVARITQGQVRLRRERVPIREILERAVEATRFLIAERGHTLSVSQPADDVGVYADAMRLEQVVVNLLSNAAKYTERGGHIELSAEQREGDVVIRVRDDGIGIEAEMLPRIFDSYVQAANGVAPAPGGLGIGLTVVKRLVTLHEGRVEAHSEGLGKGAEFVVRLAAVSTAGTKRADGLAPSERPTNPAGARILVVEDHVDAADALAMLLTVFGHRVRVARDGPSALEAARAEVPALMLVDIGLPGMDGYEVARRVRETAALDGVVLVALTGFGNEADRKRALAAGFDAHLTKPVVPAVLRGLVERLTAHEEGAQASSD